LSRVLFLHRCRDLQYCYYILKVIMRVVITHDSLRNKQWVMAELPKNESFGMPGFFYLERGE
jgi:hypothetical protein